MLIYTAGPYSESAGVGTVEENISRAADVAVKLWDMGYAVICPHLNTANFENLTQLSNKDFVDRDLEMVQVCDGIVMLPYWEHSLGAVRELECAHSNGLQVWFWPDVPEVLSEAQKSTSVKKGHRLRVRGTRMSRVKR
jgi:hypothetical protein